MKTKEVLLITAFLSSISFSAIAQSANADYDRNSLTILSVKHQDNWDMVLENYLRRSFPGDGKFDQTSIPITTIRDAGNRFFFQKEGPASQQNTYINAHRPLITDQLVTNAVASQVIGAWFNRSKNGMMDLSVIQSRADYNATDATVNIASSQALGRYLLHSNGVRLVDNSYVLVVDHSAPSYEFIQSNNGKLIGVEYQANAFGYLYKVEFTDQDCQRVFDCWIYPDDSAAELTRKNEAWSKIHFRLTPVTDVHAYGRSSKTFTEKDKSMDGLDIKCVEDCVRAVIANLDKKIEGWQVKSSIYSVHPITSKIGTKEGLKNMDRYRVEEFELDKEGAITVKNKGYVRATFVRKNNRVSSGNSSVSEFYQISGGKLEPGMRLTQKKDLGLSAKALYYMGATSGYGVELDMPIGMNTSGSCFHVRVGGSLISLGHVSGKDMGSIDVRMGFGYGVRPIRQLEIIPAAFVVLDGFSEKGVSSSFRKNQCWGAEFGLDGELTVYYPVKVLGGVFYDVPILSDTEWRSNNQILESINKKRLQGLTYRMGLVIEF